VITNLENIFFYSVGFAVVKTFEITGHFGKVM